MLVYSGAAYRKPYICHLVWRGLIAATIAFEVVLGLNLTLNLTL